MTLSWMTQYLQSKTDPCRIPHMMRTAVQEKLQAMRLPFGISSAPEEFQRQLQTALYGIEGVAVVADNVLVVGKGDSMEEARRNHDDALVQLLMRACKANIKFNKDKMRLHMPELLYIGHRILGNGVKVVAIKGMATPNSASDVRRFLGMCNYLARFILNLSQVSEQLRRLTEGDVEFAWGPTEQAAFNNIKDLSAAISFWHSMTSGNRM